MQSSQEGIGEYGIVYTYKNLEYRTEMLGNYQSSNTMITTKDVSDVITCFCEAW